MSNPFRYSGEMLDEETGMYYLRARYYDPSVGRFISEDTYKGQVDNPLTLNRYTYVHNNPVNNIDPTGNWCESADGKWSHAGGCNSSDSNWSPDGMHVWDDIKENGKVVGEYGYWDYLKDEVFTLDTVIEVSSLSALNNAHKVTQVAKVVNTVKGTGKINLSLKPTATNQKLQNVINELYRPNGTIGSGSTMDAIRYELRTGHLVGGKPHVQKGIERVKNLENVIKKQNLSPEDKALAEALLNDLKNALTGK